MQLRSGTKTRDNVGGQLSASNTVNQPRSRSDAGDVVSRLQETHHSPPRVAEDMADGPPTRNGPGQNGPMQVSTSAQGAQEGRGRETNLK